MRILQEGENAPLYGDYPTERIAQGVYRILVPNVYLAELQLVCDEINSLAKISRVTDGFVELNTCSFSSEGFTFSDNILQNGSNLILTLFPEYTNEELSAIAHAQSILLRQARPTNNLRQLALSIGAPNPKPKK